MSLPFSKYVALGEFVSSAGGTLYIRVKFLKQSLGEAKYFGGRLLVSELDAETSDDVKAIAKKASRV